MSRIGKAVGLVVFFSTMAAVAGLILWPKVVGATWAMITWTDAEKEICAAAPDCVVNVVPGGVVSVWWAILWVGIIVTAIIVCRRPERWWSSRGRGPFEFIADSSPRWLRVHAFAAAFVCALLSLPGKGITTTWALQYLIPTALALAAAGLATLSIRHARRVLSPDEYARLVGDSALVDRMVRRHERRARRTPRE
ncbi:hypothetical protein [Microbacterium sp. 2FI]|uniref:hypothetical protein n=1 Tax=Microbacterium sp. 2FI TaxID=2502193 RepID=UPI0010F9D955|nr:hypothetical protein [Microbacterium sp. 2FI]